MIYKDYYRTNKGSKKHALSRWLFDKATVLLKYTNRSKNITPNKIIIICNGHIGDTVMSTAVFREIKKVYPKAEVTALCSRLAAPILEKNPYINKIIAMDFFWRKENRNWKAIKEYFKVSEQIRKEKYDLGIALRSDLPNIYFLLYKSGVKNMAGYYNLDGGKYLLNNPFFYPEQEQHSSIADLNLVNLSLHMSTKVNTPEIHFDKEDIGFTNMMFNEYDINNYICICPGACAKLQTWDLFYYEMIVYWMKKEYPNYKVLLCGSKSDEKIIDTLALNNNNCIKLIDYNIRHLGIVFNHADAVLLQDGGPMHVAYAMMKEADKKLIVLWGPNPLDHVAPLRGKIIHHKLDCYPCMRQESLCKKPEGKRCMDLITIEEVKQAIQEALNER